MIFQESDEAALSRMGYRQELARRMSAFSNYAISLSMICILAGGITSFHQGLGSVGGAAIGIGWPFACLFSLAVAATMGQVASAFPTAGGLYHWASILGGRGWGWATAWFNLCGLVAVLSAINTGMILFASEYFFPLDFPTKLVLVVLVTVSQAAVNHRGIALTTKLTDFSGWWILGFSAVLAVMLLAASPGLPFARLITFQNFSGPVWPATDNMAKLFALGLLLPAYTITGFDASAHTAEETVNAAQNVPRGIVRSVLVSGVAGWILLCAIVLAAPDLAEAARRGDGAFHSILVAAYPGWAGRAAAAGIVLAQYLCGLATLTSTSRMTYAFARDGGLPRSLSRVSARHRSPARAIWAVAALSVVFMLYTPVYDTLAAAAALFLYLSYVLPTVLGLFAYGKSWRAMGPWHLGRWYRPLAVVSVVGCAGLVVIGMQPPNEKCRGLVGGAVVLLAAVWWLRERYRFTGPPACRPD